MKQEKKVTTTAVPELQPVSYFTLLSVEREDGKLVPRVITENIDSNLLCASLEQTDQMLFLVPIQPGSEKPFIIPLTRAARELLEKQKWSWVTQMWLYGQRDYWDTSI